MTSLPTNRTLAFAASTVAFGLVSLVGRSAHADDTIRHPGDHAPYYVEIEPHLAFAYGNWSTGVGGDPGYGIGARFSIPIVKNGFVPTINNSVAIGFGADFLHFGCGGEGFNCSLNSLSFPVVLQWNFYVSRDWSVFGEPGLFLYHQFFSYGGETCTGPRCPGVTQTSLLPAFYLGARYHINDRMALTFRVGYPTINVGFSFFD
jgi:hypothetical protein